MRHLALCALAAALVPIWGCGNAFNCEIYGDNVSGRIDFSGTVSPVAGTGLVVEVSVDDATFADPQTATVDNLQGLVSVPYSACVDSGTIRVRAFQDDNGNGTYDVGEGAGRYDGTTGGHAAHKTFTLANPDENANDADSEWPTQENVSVTLDDTAGQ